MAVFRKLMHRDSPTVHSDSIPLFNGVPGPSPWYLTPTTRTVPGFSWQSAGTTSLSAGKALLVGPRGPVAILNYYNYVMMLDESSLLIWYQTFTKIAPTAPVRLLVIQPNSLSVLDSRLDSLYERMNAERLPLIIGGHTCAEMILSTVNVSDDLSSEFPAQLQTIDELLILCQTSAIGVPSGRQGSNLALLVAHPKQARYRLYPQDWFNSGALDYGYQWVTRVARNPRTGQVHGEGFRIDPFILDDSMRRLRIRPKV